jgi:hypothetical protein
MSSVVRESPYRNTPPVLIRTRDLVPGMTVFRRTDDDAEVERYRILLERDQDWVTESGFLRKGYPVVTLLAIDPVPSFKKSIRIFSDKLRVGDWFDPFSSYGTRTRLVLSIDGDTIRSRGLSSVNPNFDTLANIEMSRDYGYVYRVPAPEIIDGPLRKVMLGGNQWTLLLPEDIEDLGKLIET